MARVIFLSSIFFLVGCTIYQSPERRKFESDSSTFSVQKNSTSGSTSALAARRSSTVAPFALTVAPQIVALGSSATADSQKPHQAGTVFKKSYFLKLQINLQNKYNSQDSTKR